MIRIRVFRISCLLYYLFIAILALCTVFLTVRLLSGRPVNPQDLLKGGYTPLIIERQADAGSFFDGVLSQLIPKVLKNPKDIIAIQMPFANDSVSETEQRAGINSTPATNVVEVSRGDRATLDEWTVEDSEIFLKDDPEISEDIKIKIADIKDDLAPIEITGDGPQVMIYHTHSREAYRQDSENTYPVAEAFRCDDLNYTVVRVGDVLAKNLQERGIQCLHDRTEHEQGDHSTSYTRSINTLKNAMNKYQSLKIFIDLHRNAYDEGVKNPDDEVVVIDGQRVAKVFALIGTGEGYVGGYKEKPDWKENYKLALRLTNKLREIHPELAKDIMVTRHRYNQHVSTKAVLLEVGSNLTTLKEAERTAVYIAQAISEILGS